METEKKGIVSQMTVASKVIAVVVGLVGLSVLMGAFGSLVITGETVKPAVKVHVPTDREVRDQDLDRLQERRSVVIPEIAQYKEAAEKADRLYFARTQELGEIDEEIATLQNQFIIDKSPRKVSDILIQEYTEDFETAMSLMPEKQSQ